MSEILKANHRKVYGNVSNSSSSSSISMSPSGSATNKRSTRSAGDNRSKLSHDMVAGAASLKPPDYLKIDIEETGNQLVMLSPEKLLLHLPHPKWINCLK